MADAAPGCSAADDGFDHPGPVDGSLEVGRPLIDCVRITGSGTQSERWTAEVVGVDRTLCATDHPCTFGTGDPFIETSAGLGRSYLEEALTFTPEQKAAIGAGNRQRLIAPVTRAFE